MLFFLSIMFFFNYLVSQDQQVVQPEQTDINSQGDSANQNTLLLSNVNQFNLDSSQKAMLNSIDKIVEKDIDTALKKNELIKPVAAVPVVAVKKENAPVAIKLPCKIKALCPLMDIQIKEAKLSNIIMLISKISGITILVSIKDDPLIRNIYLEKKTIEYVLEYLCEQITPKLELTTDGEKIKLLERGTVSREIYETETITLRIANINAELKKSIDNIWQAITQKNTNCVFNLDADTRKITLRATREQISDFKKFLESIDAQKNQVKLDMVLLIARSTFVQELGINWSGIYNRLSSLKGKNFGFVGLGGRLTDFPTPTQPINTTDGNLFVDPTNLAANLFNAFTDLISCGSAIASTVSSCFSTLPVVFGGPDLNTRRLNIILNAAEQESLIRIRSKPSIVISNNQLAKLLVGQSLPIYTSVQDVVQSNIRTLSQLNYKEIGLAIQILPSISSDRKFINLDIFVENAEVTSGNTLYNDTGIAQTPPVLTVLKLKNQVTLLNGQTTMIGGLNVSSSQIDTNRIPFLWKVPFFGKLFQAKAEQNSDEQAFVFITPTIIENE